MIFLVTVKNEGYTIKNEGARGLTTLNIDFSDTQGQLTLQSAFGFSQISNLSALLCLWLNLITCKNEEDSIKNEGARVLIPSLHYESMGIFRDDQEQPTPQSLVESGRNSDSFETL